MLLTCQAVLRKQIGSKCYPQRCCNEEKEEVGNMPIFVQWKWIENTRSFVVIFHFIDDYTKSNLRITKSGFWANILEQKGIPNKGWMTWAPSHIELAMLAELLHIANIVDGLNDSIKRKLRPFLVGDLRTGEEVEKWAQLFPRNITGFIGEDVLAELCEEYIEYLKKLLSPYLRSR